MALVRKKLSPAGVKRFEKMAGFKTTGEVYIQTHDSKTQSKIDEMLEKLYLPKQKANTKE